MSDSNSTFTVPSLPSENFDSSENGKPSCSQKKEIKTKNISNYNPPEWCENIPSDSKYNLDIIKNGVIVETVKLNESKNISYFTIGRMPENDIVMLHPSISRVHAIIQYGDGDDGIGYYIIDNASAHKTKLNRKVLDPKKFVKLRNGFNIQLGGSTRFIVFNGPDEEQEREDERHYVEYTKLKEMLKLKKNPQMMNVAPQPKFDYDSYDSRDNYEAAVEDTLDESKNDQAEEFWNEMARRRKHKKDDDKDGESLWDETKSIADIRKRKAEEEAFIESLKVKHKDTKNDNFSQEEIRKKIIEIQKCMAEEKEKIDAILKEYKIDDDLSSLDVLLDSKMKLPKKQGLTVPISSVKKMQLAHSKNILQSLETELRRLQKLGTFPDDQNELPIPNVLPSEDE
uniref:FHA domain-containing protein n=1 Tax=Strongyloides stercoralis TaxID=6248 RepID=A0A0K0EFI2_STRER